jgi:hypothetical protein
VKSESGTRLPLPQQVGTALDSPGDLARSFAALGRRGSIQLRGSAGF